MNESSPLVLGPTGDLRWMVALRWAAIAGQIATIWVVRWGMEVSLPLVPLATIVGIEALTNGLVGVWLRGYRETPTALPVALLTVDVLALTALLYFTGGPHNPFNFLYLVYIALSAVVLRPSATWGLAALSVAAFGVLFFDSVPLGAMGGATDPHAHHRPGADGDAMALHMRGMWVGFTVGAAFIVYFVTRVKHALAGQEEALAEARDAAQRSERLASLATLAAGAAHELATPLGTIAVAARELELTLEALPGDAVEDARLIRSQVARCRTVLDRLAVDAGRSRGETQREVTLKGLIDQALVGLSIVRVDVSIPTPLAAQPLRGFPTALAQSLRAVISNGLDASDDGRVRVVASEHDGTVTITVSDQGGGMDAATLARATEPFFTTKPPRQGMGLGLFLARTALERLGGELRLRSRPGEGTTVDLSIPTS